MSSEDSKERTVTVLNANCRRERAGTPEGSSVTKQGGVGGIRIEQNGDAETM